VKSLYLIGSLRNPKIPSIAAALRKVGLEVFDDWYAAGPEADDYWQRYEKARGHTFQQALNRWPAQHVYSYDRYHLDRCDAALMVKAGCSAHYELGYMAGSGKPNYILLEQEPERWDCMYGFADQVFISEAEMLEYFDAYLNKGK
jgi:nucleoside 2-deoxyribosyltransferase